MNLSFFLEQNCFYNESVCFFWLQAFWKTGSVAFFPYEFIIFFVEQNCFLMRVFAFFRFRHFGRRFCGLFSYEFISFFETELFF